MILNSKERNKIPTRYKDKISYIEEILQKYSIKYNLTNINLYDDMKYSIVGCAISKKYGEIVFKLIIENDFDYSEVSMLKMYNKNYSCKLLAVEERDNFFILEKLIPGTKLAEENISFSKKTKIVSNLIDNLIIPYNNTSYGIKEYSTLLKEAYLYCNKYNLFNTYIKKCDYYYNIIKSKKMQLYFLHNDLHTYNILKSNNKFKSIDPHGIIAEKIFEYPPFIINEHWANKDNNEYIFKVIDEIIKNTNESKVNLMLATYIHLFLSTVWFKEDDYSDNLINNNLKTLNLIETKINKLIKNV